MFLEVATGLALTIFGTGLSALFGLEYVGKTIEQIEPIHIPLLTDLPIVGRILFGHDPLIYLAIAILGLTAWFLRRTRAGMVLRAVGDSDYSAHAIGYPVIARLAQSSFEPVK